MYPYHNKIKQRIANNELCGYYYDNNRKNIGECIILKFSTEPYEKPIRPHRYKEYEKILKIKL